MPIVADVEFNEQKHYLGSLCKREHDYKGTGHSLRYLPKQKNGRCLYCGRIDALASKKRNASPEKDELRRERGRKRYHEKLKNDPKYKQEVKDYREKNRDKLLEYGKEWRKNNQEIIKGYQESGKMRKWSKKYYATEKGRFMAIQSTAKRRQRKKKKGSEKYTFSQKNQKFVLFDNRCSYCGNSGKMTIEHVIPLHDPRGFDRLENIIPACENCNCYGKSRRKLVSWYPEQDFFMVERLDKIFSFLGESELDAILEDLKCLHNSELTLV